MNFLFVIPRTGTAILLLVLSMTLAFHPTYAADTPNTKQIDTTGSLSIVDAAALALQGSPMLDAFSFDVRAAEARKLQAGYRPNPKLEFEAEDLRWHPTDRCAGKRAPVRGQSRNAQTLPCIHPAGV